MAIDLRHKYHLISKHSESYEERPFESSASVVQFLTVLSIVSLTTTVGIELAEGKYRTQALYSLDLILNLTINCDPGLLQAERCIPEHAVPQRGMLNQLSHPLIFTSGH